MNEDNLSCPRCGNININKIGFYYQCQSKKVGFNHIKGCGFIAEKHVFEAQKRL